MTRHLQFRFCQHTYVFRFRLGFFLLCLFFATLFCVLGVWQLHRYQFKKDLLMTYQQRLNGTPMVFSNIASSAETLPFQKVIATGIYLNQFTLLIQNQFYHDQLGYEVLTPLQISDDTKLLLVDRGWIPATSNHTAPNIPNVIGKQKILGYIKVLNEFQFTLGQNILDTQHYPLVIQKIDFHEINQVTKKTFYPVVLRLDVSQPNGFVRDWTITNVIPQRHMGYAVQWFAMAFVLIIAYLCFARTDHESR